MTLISKVNDFSFESTLYSFNYWFFLLLLSPLWVDKMLCIISTYIKILEYTWNIQELLNIPKDWTPLRLKLYIGLNKMCRTSLHEIYVPMKIKEQNFDSFVQVDNNTIVGGDRAPPRLCWDEGGRWQLHEGVGMETGLLCSQEPQVSSHKHRPTEGCQRCW